MKKTKILVPAMAVLALGMAAAVTGTVAWYSSTNIVYANGLAIQSKTATSLQIALDPSDNWGTVVDHSSVLNNSVNPAYCLNEAGTLDAAPSFVYLDADKVDNPGTGEGQDAWYVDYQGKVREFVATETEAGSGVYENKVVAPAAAATGNPWKNDTPNANGQMINVQSDDDYLKLDSTETGLTKNVHAKVVFARTAVQLIDQALIFGFYNHQTKKFETFTPFATGEALNNTYDAITDFSVGLTASKYTFYMWYNGESPVAINQNAIANKITATITYSVVD